MPIHPPGVRDRRHRTVGAVSRKVVASLSLTAMVDMFTVLTIFLLQNYNVTGQILNIPKDVVLPQASAVKELSPSLIVIVTKEQVMVNAEPVINFTQVKEQKDWMIAPLYNRVSRALKEAQVAAQKDLKANLKKVVNSAKSGPPAVEDESWKKITLQADKDTDFLSVKKVMYTLTEAGASEINFAVVKTEKPQGSLAE